VKSASIDPDALLGTQRRLRDRLLNGGRAGSLASGRELAAEMLLYLDDPQCCLESCGRRLVETIGGDRVDAGFSNSKVSFYEPAFEFTRAGVHLRKLAGIPMDASDPSIASVWASQHVVIFTDIRNDRRLRPALKRTLLKAGTERKLAVALREDAQEVGLLCIDATVGTPNWDDSSLEWLDAIAREVLAPILCAVRSFAEESEEDAPTAFSNAAPIHRVVLTTAEKRIARLVLAGLSYKEIARQVNRSTSTVDHQLRSLRAKLGVISTAKLVFELRAFPDLGAD
jgi:DNA-binding CsgD family transcriptional regulator